jgi:hypothetical protein
MWTDNGLQGQNKDKEFKTIFTRSQAQMENKCDEK